MGARRSIVIPRRTFLKGLVLTGLLAGCCPVQRLSTTATPAGSVASPEPRPERPTLFVTVIGEGETATFLMGSTDEELTGQPKAYDSDYITDDEQPAHEVTLTVPYEMSKYEVTNHLFCEVMNWAIDRGDAVILDGNLANGSGIVYLGITHLCDDSAKLCTQHGIALAGEYIEPLFADHPVHAVTWYGAVAFCNFLSEKEGLEPVYDLPTWACDWAKNGYRLPTEAEWEYAARGNERYTYAWGDEISPSYLNYGRSQRPFGTITMPVGFYDGTEKEGLHTENNVSPLGLYDMTGNLWEWCWDWYGRDYYGQSPSADPRGPEMGDDRPPYHVDEPTKVWRGCGWAGNHAYSRVAKRWSSTPDLSINEVGFRIARSLI